MDYKLQEAPAMQLVEEDKSYYTTIESKILDDKRLTDRQFRIIARIYSFFKQKREFFGSNKYLAEMHGIKERAISKDIHAIIELGYFKSRMETYKNGSRRIIYRGGVAPQDQRGVAPQDYHNIDKSYSSNVESEKLPTTSPDKVRLLTLTKDNEKLMRHLPKTVRNKPVTFREAGGVLAIMTIYNEVRSLYKNKDSSVSPNLKGCIQAVELIRDEVDLHNIDETFHNMFSADYHKENNWIHLTPEFVTRTDKFQKYE